MIRTFRRVEVNDTPVFVEVKVVLENDTGPIDLTNDEHILRNLDYTNPRLRVEYG